MEASPACISLFSYTCICIDSSNIAVHSSITPGNLGSCVEQEKKRPQRCPGCGKPSLATCPALSVAHNHLCFYLFSLLYVYVCTCLHVGTWMWRPDVNIWISRSSSVSLHTFFFPRLFSHLNLEFTGWLGCLASQPQGPGCTPLHLTFYMGVGKPNTVPHAGIVSISPTPSNFFSFIGLIAKILFYFFSWRKPISLASVGELCQALKRSFLFPIIFRLPLKRNY